MLTKAERKLINQLVTSYETRRNTISQFMQAVLLAIRESPTLKEHIHSIKSRPKSTRSLRRKLSEKLEHCKEEGKVFSINEGNLLSKVNDLAGIRIMHLHTRQFSEINKTLKSIFKEQRYRLVEEPFARTWDDESRAFFLKEGLTIEKSPTFYTSVHYVIESNSRTKVTCEIQVRTLMEEVWGEVDHSINYPNPSRSLACREQIKALARVTSAATRLVDSIFSSLDDFKKAKKKRMQ